MWRLFRVCVAVALTAYVIWKAHPSEVLRSAAGADWRWLAAAVALLFVDRALMAHRWLVLLCALTPGSRPAFGAVLRIFFISSFVGSFLPSVGGDVYRAYSLSRMNVSGAESAASVLMDRMLGVLSIVLVGLAALAFTPRLAADRWVQLTLASAAGMCLIAGLGVFSERFAALGQRAAGRLPGRRAQQVGGRVIEAVRRYARHHGELANVLGMSIAVQIVRVLQAWCLGRALGIEAGLLIYFVCIPIALLIMLLPVTVYGLGTSQWAFGWLFGSFGVPMGAAVALSILFITLGAVGTLPGGILYALGTRAERQAT